MGLLDGTTNKEYYEGNDLGNYQFTSLSDIINQFMVVYVGENKIIPKASRVDVAFHAQRALRELSFDTLKSVKAQQIDIPPTLVMPLPHDYVNYTKLSWVDSAGIKHPLYPTSNTSNPFSIKQEESGEYFFENNYVSIINGDFDQPLSTGWNISSTGDKSSAWNGITSSINYPLPDYIYDTVGIVASELEFAGLWLGSGGFSGRSYGAWQRVDVSNALTINLSANGQSAAQILEAGTGTVLCDFGILRVGITTTDPAIGWLSQGTSGLILNASYTNANHASNPSPNQYAEYLDVGYLEWDDGSTTTQELNDIDVTALDEIWVYVQSQAPWSIAAQTTPVWQNDPATPKVWTPTSSVNNTFSKNKVDSITVTVNEDNPSLTSKNTDGNSSTWSNYKSGTPSENQDDYQDDTYWPMEGSRFGLDPQHAQANGSFYIDPRLGRIHFSSNISGKTVILDYISDSLGTDAEMQVHKFAEDAMYKWINHAMLSGSSYGQPLVPRLTKEKFAAVRKAKLRLSNIKLEELTQILRGKSKQIKH